MQPQPKIEAKFAHYVNDGTGRDNYIYRVNGGLFHEKMEDPKGFEIGTFLKKRQYYPPNSYVPAKHIHYRTDGTGRDTYINVDEGGLSIRYGQKPNFVKSLRGYEQIQPIRASDYLSKSQNSRPKSVQKQNQMMLQQQFNLTTRLSVPKVIQEDPYARVRVKSALPGLRTLYG